MKRKRKLGQDNLWGYLMIAPTIIGLIILNVYPFIDTIILSFCKSGVFGGRTFAGLDNYIKMFGSSEFCQAAWNTVYFCMEFPKYYLGNISFAKVRCVCKLSTGIGRSVWLAHPKRINNQACKGQFPKFLQVGARIDVVSYGKRLVPDLLKWILPAPF